MKVVLISMLFTLLVISNGRTISKQNSDTLESVSRAFPPKQRLNGDAASFDQQMRQKRKNEGPLILPIANELMLEQSTNYEPREEEIEHSRKNGSSLQGTYIKNKKQGENERIEKHKTSQRVIEIPQRNGKKLGAAAKSHELSYGRSMVKSYMENLYSKQGTVNYLPGDDIKSKDKRTKNEESKQFDMLDKLDDIMMKEQQVINPEERSLCAEPKLDFCGNAVTYPIAKAQLSVHSFYDGLAESALDFLTIQTKGQSRMCKKQLTAILCRDRFPRCEGTKVSWGNLREECGKAVESCPLQVQESLRNMDLCRKIGKGETPIAKCIPPIRSHDSNHCLLTEETTVAPWNRHASVEVENLIEIQTTLFSILGSCLDKLYDYLCLPTKMCRSGFSTLKAEFTNRCKSTLKACENSTFSKGMEKFFRCKFPETTETNQQK